MIKTVALLLVVAFLGSFGRLLVCGLDCHERRAEQHAATCHDGDGEASDVRLAALHACDHDSETVAIIAAKTKPTVQLQGAAISAVPISHRPVTRDRGRPLIVAAPPGNVTGPLLSAHTVLRI